MYSGGHALGDFVKQCLLAKDLLTKQCTFFLACGENL